MNTKAVKSFGLALMLAAGVLAVLLALGTFSPQKAGAQATGITGVGISPGNLPGGSASFFNVGFTVAGTIYGGEEIVVTLPGFGLPGSIDAANINIRTTSGTETARGNPSNVAIDADKSTVTLTLPTNLDVTGLSSITFLRAAGVTAPVHADRVPDVAGDDTTTADQDYDIKVAYGIISGDTPDGSEFTVDRSVTVKPATGNSDSTVTVTGSGFGDGDVKIYVNQVPASLTTTPDADTTTTGFAPANLAKTVKSAKGSFTASIPVTDSKGNSLFKNGDNFIHVYGVAGGERIVDGDTSDATIQGQKFILNGKVKVASKLIQGTKEVEIVLTEAPVSASGAMVCVTGVTLGKDTAITDITKGAGNSVDLTPDVTTDDDATCGSERVLVDAAGKATFEFTVPSNATVGEKVALVVNGVDSVATTADAGTAVEGGLGSTTVEVASLALTLSPDTAVQGNMITLTGTGFSTSGTVTLDTLEIKEAGEEGTTQFEEVENVSATAVNGQFAFTFTVPDLAKGKATVRLTDSGGRVGEGALTISAPTIEIEPSEGRKGTQVIVRGTNFPANDQVLVTYGGGKDTPTPEVGNIVGRAATDGSGAFNAVITVPSRANVSPTKNYIQAFRPALGEDIATRSSNSVEHAVPAPSTDVDPKKGLVGATITVSGEAHPAKAAIEIKIGDSVVSDKGITTDANGDFSIEVEIPDLAQRFVALTGTVGTASITPVLIEILEPEPVPAVRDVATEFADIADVLVTVFAWDKTAKKWKGYNPEAPAAANDLSVINSGDFLWIQVSGDGTYNGEPLTPKWNLVTAP